MRRFLSVVQWTVVALLFQSCQAAEAGQSCSSEDECDVNLRSADFWRSLAQVAGVSLTITGERPSRLPGDTSKNITYHQNRMLHEGWTEVADWGDPEIVLPLMKDFVAIIKEINDVRKLPSSFLMMYDETWEVAHAISSYLEPIYDLKLSHDIFVFNAHPGYEGWGVHRDGSGADNILAFQKQDSYRDQPTYTTTWLSLTDATPETSCMHFIPAHADAEYAILDHPTGVDDGYDFDDDLEQVLIDSHRFIQAAAVPSGSALVWSHRTLHWSSASPRDAPYARLSMAFSMSKYDLDPPALKHTDLSTIPPFEARVALICYTGVAYHYNFHTPLKDRILHLLLDILADDDYAKHLTDDAISPNHPREVGWQFSVYLEQIYEDLKDMRPRVFKCADYIVNQRGLESTEFLRNLARQEANDEF